MPATLAVQKTSLSVATTTVTTPIAGLVVIGIQFNGPILSIPIDSTRSAFFINPGGTTKVATKFIPVTFTVNGTSVTFTTYYSATTYLYIYFGSPNEGQLPLSAYAGVHTAVTLSGGTGTGTWTFPAGNLTLNGVSAVDTSAAADVTINWSTSSGQSMYVQVISQTVQNNIVPTALTVSQTVSFTATGTSTDVIDTVAYYSGVGQ